MKRRGTAKTSADPEVTFQPGALLLRLHPVGAATDLHHQRHAQTHGLLHGALHTALHRLQRIGGRGEGAELAAEQDPAAERVATAEQHEGDGEVDELLARVEDRVRDDVQLRMDAEALERW